MEPPEPDVLEQPPRDANAPLLSAADYKKMTYESAVISAGALAAYGYGISRYGLGARAGSMAFQASRSVNSSMPLAADLNGIACLTMSNRQPTPISMLQWAVLCCYRY
jgi:hypothetical protein